MTGRFFNEGMTSEPGQSNRFRTAGFTLIELLVVVAVIAILASLLLPALSRAKQRAYTAVCVNNLSQIGRGVALHAMDTGYFPPYMALRDSGEKYEWWSALLPYVGDTWPQTDLAPDGQDAVLNLRDPPQSRVIQGVAGVKSIYRCPAYDRVGGFYINSSDPARPGTDIFPIGSYADNWIGAAPVTTWEVVVRAAIGSTELGGRASRSGPKAKRFIRPI